MSSFSDGPIRTPAPIAPLKVAHKNDGHLVNDILSMPTEKDVDHLYNPYYILRDLFRVYAPNLNVHVNDQISAENTIMIYEE